MLLYIFSNGCYESDHIAPILVGISLVRLEVINVVAHGHPYCRYLPTEHVAPMGNRLRGRARRDNQ